MKKGLLSLLTCFSILFASQAKAKEYFKPLTAEPSAVYDSIWIDYDVKENDVLGMKIHLSFTTYNMKGMDAFIAIYYSYNDEILNKIGAFNQFSRERYEQQGAGLGLITSYLTILRCYGTLDIKNNDKGASVTVYLPRLEPQSTQSIE